jgi:hypothetical protein
MVAYEARRLVHRPPDVVFDVIGTHVYENRPRWESEVVEIRPLTEPPVRVGSRTIMERREYGQQTEVPYEVTAFRMFTTLIARNLPKTSDRITSQMVALVESRP